MSGYVPEMICVVLLIQTKKIMFFWVASAQKGGMIDGLKNAKFHEEGTVKQCLFTTFSRIEMFSSLKNIGENIKTCTHINSNVFLKHSIVLCYFLA